MSTSYRFTTARSLIIVSLVLLATLFAFSLSRSDAAAPPPAWTPTQAQPQANAANVPACGPDWSIVSNPNVGTHGNSLHDVAAVSSDDVWAVGSYADGYTSTLTLIQHWDGSAWDIVPSPNVVIQFNALEGVAAVSSNDVWAVGSYRSGGITRTLIEHWDGNTWSIVPSPNVDALDSALAGVAAVSSNDVWAVGSYADDVGGGYQTYTLIEHWDGNTWSIVPSPSPSTQYNGLSGVAAVSSSDVWAVGVYLNGTLIEHWDGSTWSVVPSPGSGNLTGVAALSSDDVWAVGYGSRYTVIEHWDGSTWSIVPSPNGGDSNYLHGIAAVSADDIWAVGTYSNSGSASQTLISHWDGSTWSIVPSPSPGTQFNILWGIGAVSASDVWAVGFYHNGSADLTLVERYNPIPCTPTPTATSTLEPTSTLPASATPESTSEPSASATPEPTSELPPCPGERFTDVCPGDYFYTHALALANDNIILGYDTAPPCNNGLWIPCFKPYNSSTRGQISKVVSLAANFNDPVTTQTFEDVPPGSTFYTYTERMAERNIITGYPCGGPGVPCIPPANRPYFRTGNNVTRGQLSKMTALAFGWNDPPEGQQFEDVLLGSTFYTYTAQLYIRTIVGGYPCGGVPGEPCVPPNDLPYFRPNNDVTRGQVAKIVQLARIQPTPTPTSTPPPALTATPGSTSTP